MIISHTFFGEGMAPRPKRNTQTSVLLEQVKVMYATKPTDKPELVITLDGKSKNEAAGLVRNLKRSLDAKVLTAWKVGNDKVVIARVVNPAPAPPAPAKKR